MSTIDERPSGFFDEGQHLDRAQPFDLYAYDRSPLFRWGVRRISWLYRHPNPLTRYRWRVAVILITLTLTLTAFVAAYLIAPYRSVPGEAILVSGGIVLGLSFLGVFISDLLPIGSLTRFYKTETVLSDLMRLTPLSRHSVVSAYHELNVLDNWRYLTVMMALRIAASVLIVGGVLVNIVENARRSPIPIGSQDLTIFLVLLMFLSVVPAGLILEPRWRLRAMSALSLVLAVRFPQEWLRLFISVALVIGHWLLILPYIALLTYLGTGFGTLFFYPIAVPPAVFFGLRGLYYLIERWSLSHAGKRIFAERIEA